MVGVLGCFLVPACVRHLIVGGGCGCVFIGLGVKSYTSEHTVGFTFNTVLASATCCGGCPRSRPDGLLGVGVCGGLFVICIVVASIFVLYCFLCFV